MRKFASQSARNSGNFPLETPETFCYPKQSSKYLNQIYLPFRFLVPNEFSLESGEFAMRQKKKCRIPRYLILKAQNSWISCQIPLGTNKI